MTTMEMNRDLAYLIDTEGEVCEIEPANKAGSFNLEQLYLAIGCDMIEVLSLADGRLMIIDEEGKFKKEPKVNNPATQLIKARLQPYDFIVGKAVVCPRAMLR